MTSDDKLENEPLSMQNDEFTIAAEESWLDRIDEIAGNELDSSSFEKELEASQDEIDYDDKDMIYLSELEKMMLLDDARMIEENNKADSNFIVDEDGLEELDQPELLVEDPAYDRANAEVAALLEDPADDQEEVLVRENKNEDLLLVEEERYSDISDEIEPQKNAMENSEHTSLDSDEQNMQVDADVQIKIEEQNEQNEVFVSQENEDVIVWEEDLYRTILNETDPELMITDGLEQRDYVLDEQMEKEDLTNVQSVIEKEKVVKDIEDEWIPKYHLDEGTNRLADDAIITEEVNVPIQVEGQTKQDEHQKQVFQTMLMQADISKKTLDDDQYEQLLISYLSYQLPASEWYTFARLLAEHYMRINNENSLVKLLEQMEEEFSQYPILLQEIHYLQEQYAAK